MADAARLFVLQQLDRSLAHGHITETDRGRLASLYDQLPDLGDGTDVPDDLAKSKVAVARLRREASEDAAASPGAVTLLSVVEELWEAIDPPVTDTKSDFHDFVVTVGAVQGAIAGGVAGGSRCQRPLLDSHTCSKSPSPVDLRGPTPPRLHQRQPRSWRSRAPWPAGRTPLTTPNGST
jgi:hypothetical protein